MSYIFSFNGKLCARPPSLLLNHILISVFQADSFQRTSTRVARKYWWKNIKMMILIGVIVLVIVVLIILAATGVI